MLEPFRHRPLPAPFPTANSRSPDGWRGAARRAGLLLPLAIATGCATPRVGTGDARSGGPRQEVSLETPARETGLLCAAPSPRAPDPTRPPPAGPPVPVHDDVAEAWVAPTAANPGSARRFAWSVGVLGGACIAGPQDLKFKKGNALGEFTDFMFAPRAEASTEPFASAFVTMWVKSGRLRDFGFRAEASHWETDVRAGTLVDRIVGPTPSETPSFTSVHEERTAILGTLLWRFPVAGIPPKSEDSPYGYLGLGTGLVYTSVEHGLTGWDVGSQAVAGVSLPLAPSVRLLLEGRYMITHDQDFRGVTTNYRVDTSGTPVQPGWAHLDTRFYTLLVGLEIEL